LCLPPQQYARSEIVRPDGCLALAYLDAALTAAGFESRILDMSIGTDADSLDDTFFRHAELDNGFIRVGMSPARILEEARDADVIAISSVFTQQTSRCFEVADLLRREFPEKILIAGGGNARVLKEHFFDHGFDFVFTSESEQAIVDFAHWLATGKPDLAALSGIAFRDGSRTVVLSPPRLVTHLDDYPIPSWEKLPNERYWEIGRVASGRRGWIEDDPHPRYASIYTSRGCPFRCTYCHISLERGGEAGDIGSLRLHSIERVDRELEKLAGLGVRYVSISDDSFLAKRARVFDVLAVMRRYGFRLTDFNGVNVIHFFRRSGGHLVVDEELLEALFEAGFRKMTLPFESGSQRLIDKYSTGKWSTGNCDIEELIRAMMRVGIVTDANFMIGYPDETLDELTATFLLARRGMDAGLIGCNFFIVQPFPGSRLFEESVANGQLPSSWHWDDIGWSKGSPFTRLVVPPETLRYCWGLVWRLLNPVARVDEALQLMPTVPGSLPGVIRVDASTPLLL
jgi:radical SAM superfamily enzyme YgiQ (UPF0313 family)